VTSRLTASQSVCLGIEHPCGTCYQILLPVGMLLSVIYGPVSVRRPLWREDDSAIPFAPHRKHLVSYKDKSVGAVHYLNMKSIIHSVGSQDADDGWGDLYCKHCTYMLTLVCLRQFTMGCFCRNLYVQTDYNIGRCNQDVVVCCISCVLAASVMHAFVYYGHVF
jgi:hypothetical protein